MQEQPCSSSRMPSPARLPAPLPLRHSGVWAEGLLARCGCAPVWGERCPTAPVGSSTEADTPLLDRRSHPLSMPPRKAQVSRVTWFPRPSPCVPGSSCPLAALSALS